MQHLEKSSRDKLRSPKIDRDGDRHRNRIDAISNIIIDPIFLKS
ncbi:hypothetical protein POG22_21210 [Geitlerinema sp. CS-897]|nr:hypothetical protein [Geitlerinema sp. CS-897]